MTTAQMRIISAAQRGYTVDAHGNAFNRSGHKLAQGVSKTGYPCVGIRDEGARQSRRVHVHKLAALIWFGDAAMEDGIVVRHLDGNPFNNSAGNLALGTQSQNMMDRPSEVRSAHAAKGNQRHSPELIAKLRADHAAGVHYRTLQATYGLPKSTLSYYLSTKAKRTTYSFPKHTEKV